MMSRAEQLVQFAVHFVQVDLDRSRSGDVLNLREDLWHFLFPTGRLEDSAGLPEQAPDELSVDDLKSLQREVQDMLSIFTMAAEKALQEPDPVPLQVVFPPRLSVKPGVVMFPGHASDRIVPNFLGPFRGALLMQLFVALTHIPLDTLRHCPECQKIFYRVRHQRFCGATCRNRANTRHFREVHTDPRGDRTAEPRKDRPRGGSRAPATASSATA